MHYNTHLAFCFVPSRPKYTYDIWAPNIYLCPYKGIILERTDRDQAGKGFIRCLYDCNTTANVATGMMNEMIPSRIEDKGDERGSKTELRSMNSSILECGKEGGAKEMPTVREGEDLEAYQREEREKES